MKYAACVALCAVVLGAAETAKEVFDRAVRDLAAEDYQAAERGFQAVLRQEPRNVAALGNLGVIYSRTSRADQAITIYRRALELSPDDKALLLNLGLVYLRQEDHARALPLFARVVAIDPQHLQARQLLALCRAYTGQLGPAIRDLEALRAAAPRDENILFLLGFVYLKNHEADRAKAVFGQMFEAAGPVRAEFLLGKANYEAALFPQAEESYLRVLQLDALFNERLRQNNFNFGAGVPHFLKTVKVTLRAEAFNLPNHPEPWGINTGFVGDNPLSGISTTALNFGQINAYRDARTLQLAGRVSF